MRKCRVAIFTLTLVAALCLTGLFVDIHFLRHSAFVTYKYWTNTFNSINKRYPQTGTNTDAKDHTIITTDANNRAISQTHTENPTINPTDTKNRTVSLTGTKDRVIIPTDAVSIGNQTISLACPVNSLSPPLDDETKKKFEFFDLLRVKTPAFLSNYKNPCWKQGNPSKLACLPYFHQIGFPKCGSTFTYHTIVRHPGAVKGKAKEPQWFGRSRFKRHSNFRNYLEYFSPAATVIESNVSTDSTTGKKFHPIITGDGSVTTAWLNPYWRYLPGNYNCREPRVLNPHYIYHLNPSAKVLILIRNPTERMISHYNFNSRDKVKTAESFHQKMVQDLRTIKDCCSKNSLKFCAYGISVDVPSAVTMRVGLYHVFIRDWLNVFPADQILIARLEDTYKDPYRAFTRIFDFLGLRRLSRSELEEITTKSPTNKKMKEFQTKNETRRLLDDFYRPHNIQLARLLQQHDPTIYSNVDDAMYSH